MWVGMIGLIFQAVSAKHSTFQDKEPLQPQD
jgi:hypothetical protein